MISANVLAFAFLVSGSVGQATDGAAGAQGGNVNPRILNPGLQSFISTGLGFATGIAQGLSVGNSPGSFGAFNQPHAINFGVSGPGAFHGSRPSGFGNGFPRPGVGTIGNGFNSPLGIEGNFGRPSGGNFNRPGFGGSSGFGGNFNRPGSFGGNFIRPGNFGGNFNRPGNFGGGFHIPGINTGLNKPGDFGGNLHNHGFNSELTRPGSVGSFNNGHEGLNDNINNANTVNKPGVLGFPFMSSLSKQGSCPPVRPKCPGNIRVGPIKCTFDLDCSTGEKCCPDTCLEFNVCKKAK